MSQTDFSCARFAIYFWIGVLLAETTRVYDVHILWAIPMLFTIVAIERVLVGAFVENKREG